MTDISSLAERVHGKLTQEATRKDPDLRRVLGHAKLLDSLFIELSATESTWNESDAHEKVVVGSEEDRCDHEDSDDSDSDSDSDSDLDWASDSDSDSDTDSDSDSDSDSGSEWRAYACSADVESAVRDWTRWEAAKPLQLLGERTIKVGVQEVRDEIEIET
ncbi:hypothetical protein DL98DRAFT_522847 [Cadophora sp. DSE1049]|nr:hypothetical protein DL98DRAFT_522847 [Cadophora sp. DSE1049]